MITMSQAFNKIPIVLLLTINQSKTHLHIPGEVGEDIEVSLTEAPEAAGLRVEAGAGGLVLVLASALDREGVAGPSSLRTSLSCTRLGTGDPGILIPVTVRSDQHLLNRGSNEGSRRFHKHGEGPY